MARKHDTRGGPRPGAGAPRRRAMITLDDRAAAYYRDLALRCGATYDDVIAATLTDAARFGGMVTTWARLADALDAAAGRAEEGLLPFMAEQARGYRLAAEIAQAAPDTATLIEELDRAYHAAADAGLRGAASAIEQCLTLDVLLPEEVTT